MLGSKWWAPESVQGFRDSPRRRPNMAEQSKSLVNTVELGRAIRRKREEMGLSLRDVADETGVSASTLSRIENGTGKPDADNIARLTGWLQMPMERVMGAHTAEGDDAAQSAVVYFPQEAMPDI